MIGTPRFIVDGNVGKLAKWLRLMGYDTRSFTGREEFRLVAMALDEDRVILTRNTRLVKRRVITSGRLRAVLLRSDEPRRQIRQVVVALGLDWRFKPFTICLECNQVLVERGRGEVRERVPPYVFQTQSQFRECPACHRLYWRGTHWRAMTERLEGFMEAV